jgi:hypothetical protein
MFKKNILLLLVVAANLFNYGCGDATQPQNNAAKAPTEQGAAAPQQQNNADIYQTGQQPAAAQQGNGAKSDQAEQPGAAKQENNVGNAKDEQQTVTSYGLPYDGELTRARIQANHLKVIACSNRIITANDIPLEAIAKYNWFFRTLNPEIRRGYFASNSLASLGQDNTGEVIKRFMNAEPYPQCANRTVVVKLPSGRYIEMRVTTSSASPRLIVGIDGSAYYSSNHYDSFYKFYKGS